MESAAGWGIRSECLCPENWHCIVQMGPRDNSMYTCCIPTHTQTYGDDNMLTLCVLCLFQANIGQMDTAKDMWKMIMGNLALIQVKETPQYK